MSLFKKKTKEEPMDLDSVMKKYDRESNVRIWEGKPRIAVNVILAIFSLFCLYVTLFASWLEELRLTTFVAWIVFLGYLVFPAKKSHQRVNHIPWYDIVLMVLGTGAFLYYAFNAKAIFDNAADIAKENGKGAELSLDNATSGMTAPFHKGAAKYFAEKGITVDAQ